MNEKLFCPFTGTLQESKAAIRQVNSIAELISGIAKNNPGLIRVYASSENIVQQIDLGLDWKEIHEVYGFNRNGQKQTIGWTNFYDA